MMNLACSDTVAGAYPLGCMVNLIGDSSTGKSYQTLEMLAQVARDPRFEDYLLVRDDVEHADEFDIKELFGPELAKRLQPPKRDDEGEPVYSEVIEDFHAHVRRLLKKGKPFIYVLDSADALTSEQDEEKFNQMADAREKGNQSAGSYAMAKPKAFSQILSSICGSLRKTRSMVLIVSQTRDKIDAMAFGEKKTRSGGRALKFYAMHEIWLAHLKTLKSTVGVTKGMITGHEVRVKVSKNKLTGKERTVGFTHLRGYGVDDISSCIDFLVERGEWSKSGASLKAPDFDYVGTEAKFIKMIEEQRLERKLYRIVQRVWNEVEEAIKPVRRSKYE